MEEEEEHRGIVVFENKAIRRTWFEDEWWFVLEDLVVALTDSKDPKQYTVTMTAKGFQCDCPGFKFRGKCKHVEMIGATVDLIVS